MSVQKTCTWNSVASCAIVGFGFAYQTKSQSAHSKTADVVPASVAGSALVVLVLPRAILRICLSSCWISRMTSDVICPTHARSFGWHERPRDFCNDVIILAISMLACLPNACGLSPGLPLEDWSPHQHTRERSAGSQPAPRTGTGLAQKRDAGPRHSQGRTFSGPRRIYQHAYVS